MTHRPGERGERREVNTPTVLMFRPSEFEIVPPEGVAEWERTLQEQVGIEASANMMRSGIRCYSWCGDVVFDDCDEI